MKQLVGVQFKRAARIYLFDCGDIHDFKLGDEVIVETEFGLGLGKVICEPKGYDDKQTPPSLKKVLRLADESDIQRNLKNKEREKSALDLCLRLIKQKKLEMKLVNVEYFYDASKAIFYFSAENRVDFRDLVRDLARSLHTRIEMKQIGVRDETKLVGGMGCCGQPICCASFLREFHPVSVKMAKEQNLAMNPSKISGLCGRLMCCLAYEHSLYEEMGKNMPKKGKIIDTPDGPAKVVEINVLKRLVTLAMESGATVTVSHDKSSGKAKPPAVEKEVDLSLPEITPVENKVESEEKGKRSGRRRGRRRKKKQKGNNDNSA